MAAKGKAYCKAQRNLQGFAAILKSAACEWLLIFLMLIDALLSYVLTKFAYICNLQTPCILCSRLDHLLGKEKRNNYRNLLCTNHKLEISSLVSCYKHNKLVDGNEMCDACLCSFAATNNKSKSNFKFQRLLVGKLRSVSGGNGAHGKLLNRDSITHCIRTRPCSCCSKPWKPRPNAQGFLQLKPSVNAATKLNIPLPQYLKSRDSLKKMRDKISGSVTLQHPGKTGFNLLSHVGYSDLKIISDSESEFLLFEEDDDRSLICEKSELIEDSVLQSITKIPLKPHCNNCDQVKRSINFVDSRPSPLESYVQVDVQKPHSVKSLASDATTFHGLSELNWLPRPANPTANSSTLPELISLDDALFPASNALGLPHANSMEKSELTDSLSQEASFSCPPESTTLHHDPKVEGNLMTSEETRTDNTGTVSLNELEDHSTSSTTFAECPKIDDVAHKSSTEYANEDVDHKSVSESSEIDKEQEVSNQKETDIVSNDLEHSPLTGTTDEVVCESSIRNANDDVDHSSASKSSEGDKEQEVFNFATGQSSEKETNVVTIVEECPKTNEVVHESAIRSTHSESSKSSVSESSESDKEQEVLNFATEQPSEKETDTVTNDLKQFPLISTLIEECPKTDEVVHESAIRNTNDDMNHSSTSQSSESDKEQEVCNFAARQSFEKESNIVTDDLKESPLVGTAAEECLRTNEVVYESPIRNTNDGMDHSTVSESSDSDKEQEALNFTSAQPSKKETNIDEKVYEPAIKNTSDVKDHSSVSESSESDKEHEVFKFPEGQPSEKETGIVTNDLNQLPLQNNSVELMNHSSSDDESQDASISCHDLPEEFTYEFNIIRAHDESVPMESDVESLDGSNVSEIEGESMVDRLTRQVEYDKKCIHSLYKELEEERSASEVAASQAMAMITRLQEEKAAMHMEALHYLRMMEEQAEYDVEALEKANEVLNEKEREIQDLETELEYYRATYLGGTIVEMEDNRECNSNYSFKSAIAEATRRSNRSFNHETSSLEFDDEKVYIQLCLRSLEDKINKMSTNGILAKVPNCIDVEEAVNSKQKGEESIGAEESERNKEENGPSVHIDKNTVNGTVSPEEELVDPKYNGRFGGEENFPDVKGQISCANKREEVDFLALEHKISDLTGKLVALQADYDFLEHSLNSLRYGEEGLQFAQNIVHQLQELCKLGIRLDRLPGS